MGDPRLATAGPGGIGPVARLPADRPLPGRHVAVVPGGEFRGEAPTPTPDRGVTVAARLREEWFEDLIALDEDADASALGAEVQTVVGRPARRQIGRAHV